MEIGYSIGNPSGMNPPELGTCIRLLIYKCDVCRDINIIPDTPKNAMKKCHTCNSYLSDGMLIGDSKSADEYPGTAFRIIGVSAKGHPEVQVLFHTECRDCHKMMYLPWGWDNLQQRRRILYEECDCHKTLTQIHKSTPTVQEQVTPLPITTEPEEQDEEIIVFKSKQYMFFVELSNDITLIEAMKEYMFDTDLSKNDVIRKALRLLFESKGYIHSDN